MTANTGPKSRLVDHRRWIHYSEAEPSTSPLPSWYQHSTISPSHVNEAIRESLYFDMTAQVNKSSIYGVLAFIYKIWVWSKKKCWWRVISMYYSLICPHVSTLTLHIYGVWFLLSQSLGWFMLGLTKGCIVLGRILVKLRSWWDLGKYIYNIYICPHFICPQMFNLQFFVFVLYMFFLLILCPWPHFYSVHNIYVHI